ncbi:MAG TPA: condensation domain-containing protein [Ktedonobacteraceae bacterium]|nr:condensation domain-containing protein [Ktedonobacteraceae bacterium]
MRTRDELVKRRAALSTSQLALLEARLQQNADAGVQGAHPLASSSTLSLFRRPLEEPAVLSFAQQRFWFLQQLAPESSAYNDIVAVYLHGHLNPDAIIRALRELARRHEVLCCTFPEKAGQPVIRIDRTWPERLLLPVIDLCPLPGVEREQSVQQWARKEMRRPFLLAEELAWRTSLLRLAETEHVFLLVLHHIITDAWSQEIFLRELLALYTAFYADQPLSLPALPLQYRDYAY